jgi:pimeloyl-ACP methyl ester carboxylesterase
MNSDAYYANVPEKEVNAFLEFKKSHQPRRISVKGRPFEYYCSGENEKAMLIFHGVSTTAEFVYRRILDFEKNYKVIAPTIANIESIQDLDEAVNLVLEKEGVQRLVVMGGSFGGMIAQAYFKLNYEKINGLVLAITLAPKPERNKTWILWMIKILPWGLLRKLFKKKLGKLFESEAEIPPEAKGKIRFMQAHFLDTIDTKITKKILFSQLNLAFEFNSSRRSRPENFKDWSGKVLVISGEDDPGFKDTETLTSSYPNTESYIFPKGSGHMVPIVHEEKYLGLIFRFLDTL